MAVRRERALRAWLAIEYDRAQAAARDVAGSRGGTLGQHKHCSAVARMCALGEVVQQLDRLAG